uniref:Uncharacterized protein LOC111123571 isoform X3 n=1 Tax=Crassostrea virginica TaxID=6565 RepID=A0A8B8D0T5_CRAVI|nr:uncharacterized protein LOC111123571 isoform X3 [Crassostrea virginica]
MRCIFLLLIGCCHEKSIGKSECLQNGGKGECCTNFYRKDGKCIACPPGTYGDNCTTSCPNRHYGENCGLKCECTSDERCDPAKGCISITTAHVIITTLESRSNKETTELSIRPSSGSFLVSSITEISETSANNNAQNYQVSSIYWSTTTVGSAASSIGPNAIPVIIITGSVLSLFLIIIIINQVHEKFKKQRKAKLTSRARMSAGMPEEETYVEINESTMQRNTTRYNKLGKNQPTQNISDPPLLPGRKDSIRKITSPEKVENCSDYLDAVHVHAEEHTDNSYLNPIGKCNSYLEVVETPPEDASCTDIRGTEQTEHYQDLY